MTVASTRVIGVRRPMGIVRLGSPLGRPTGGIRPRSLAGWLRCVGRRGNRARTGLCPPPPEGSGGAATSPRRGRRLGAPQLRCPSGCGRVGRGRRTAMALLLLANALWAASHLAARVALNTLPPPLTDLREL